MPFPLTKEQRAEINKLNARKAGHAVQSHYGGSTVVAVTNHLTSHLRKLQKEPPASKQFDPADTKECLRQTLTAMQMANVDEEAVKKIRKFADEPCTAAMTLLAQKAKHTDPLTLDVRARDQRCVLGLILGFPIKECKAAWKSGPASEELLEKCFSGYVFP